MKITRQCLCRDENSVRAPVNGWCRLFSLLVVLAALSTVGCQGRSYDVAEVSGRVTLDGKPLADAQVMFQPVATSDKNTSPGPGSWGKTDSDGRYRLEIVEPAEPGAVVGTHRVTITTAARTLESLPAASRSRDNPCNERRSLREKSLQEGDDASVISPVSTSLK